ncbi:lamin tail domain-containing protein [Micromonospora sp. CPCC 205371]|nr:lamin tail domain-containing protein [Micromonospora sp. CPCC 205371]
MEGTVKKTIGLVAAVLFGATVAFVGAAPASAATPPLRFHGAQYDSPGSDTGSNTSLNAEWISLINTGASAVNLKGWTIRDKAGHVYTFTSDYTIPAKNGRLWVHTGKGTNNAQNRYWWRSWYVWNNTGDTAYLRKPSGAQVDTCTWGNKSGRTWVGC